LPFDLIAATIAAAFKLFDSFNPPIDLISSTCDSLNDHVSVLTDFVIDKFWSILLSIRFSCSAIDCDGSPVVGAG